MKIPEREDYVRYRIEKSEETFGVAELLVTNEKWNSAVNRLYYAAYYMISALLVSSAIETKTHAGAKSQFFMHYVKTGIIEVRLGKLYSDLFDWRHKGDYGDFFDFTENDVKPLLDPTRELIDAAKREIKGK